MTDILATIDAAIGCQHCGGPIGGSVSNDFCSEQHQAAWHAKRAEPLVDAMPPIQAPVQRPIMAADEWMAELRGPRFSPADQRSFLTLRGRPSEELCMPAPLPPISSWFDQSEPDSFGLPRIDHYRLVMLYEPSHHAVYEFQRTS
jgi:hypothetical protein